HEATLEPADRAEWHQAYLDSGLRFADTYPEHPESGAVLTTVSEDLFAQGQFDLAIAVGQIVVAKQPAVDPKLARTAWTVIAHSQFDSDQFVSAEASYYQLRSFTPADDTESLTEISDRIASSIYKQGEQARDAGDLEMAVTHFTRLGQVVPDSSIRATAEYDAAAALINLAAWDRASVVLEKFRSDYPDSEFADDINQKLAVTYLESGRGAQAAKEFERIAAAEASTPAVRREALWKASELYKESAAAGDEQRVLKTIIARYPDPVSESIEAQVRLLEIAEARGDNRERMALLQDIVDADKSAGEQRSERTKFLAATASLEL
ncbi:MAG: outer membrane protein assembly factor BamD, partial [Pseudomonadota bacterium]